MLLWETYEIKNMNQKRLLYWYNARREGTVPPGDREEFRECLIAQRLTVRFMAPGRAGNLAPLIWLGPGPHGLGLKKPTGPKSPPLKKPIGLKSPQKPCRPGPAHGLFYKHEKKLYDKSPSFQIPINCTSHCKRNKNITHWKLNINQNNPCQKEMWFHTTHSQLYCFSIHKRIISLTYPFIQRSNS